MARQTYEQYIAACYEECNCNADIFTASNARPLFKKLAEKLDGEQWETVNVKTGAAPALGTLANNAEYRCTNTSATAAPTMTIPEMANAAAEFKATVIFKAPNTTAPVITNNSGATLKYAGSGVASGVFTPVAGTVYRLEFVYDGINLNCNISGVA